MAVLDYDYIGQLVTQIQSGDESAFDELYKLMYDVQYKYAYKHLRDIHLAHDVTQETFMKAYEHINNIKNPRAFVNWMNTTCARMCYVMYNKQKKFNLEMSEYENNADTIEYFHTDPEDGPEEQAMLNYDKHYLTNQLAKLPTNEAEVLRLKFYKQKKMDDIASITGVSRSTAKRRVNNGKARLRKAIVGDNFYSI